MQRIFVSANRRLHPKSRRFFISKSVIVDSYLKTVHFIFLPVGSVTDAPRVDGQDITLTYTNGDKCVGQTGKFYQTKITFICKDGSTVGSIFNIKQILQRDRNVEWERGSIRKGLNATSGSQFSGRPMAKTVFRSGRAIITVDTLSLLNLPISGLVQRHKELWPVTFVMAEYPLNGAWVSRNYFKF